MCPVLRGLVAGPNENFIGLLPDPIGSMYGFTLAHISHFLENPLLFGNMHTGHAQLPDCWNNERLSRNSCSVTSPVSIALIWRRDIGANPTPLPPHVLPKVVSIMAPFLRGDPEKDPVPLKRTDV